MVGYLVLPTKTYDYHPLEPWEGGKSLEYLESLKTFILHPSTRQEALNYWYIGIYIGLEDYLYFFQ